MKKNLRKVLALVLVVALAFSLVTMASAATVADYSDATSITQKEAVDLFTQLGFLAGNGGAFDATGTITREAAAKIITYMLIGTTKADALKVTVTSFSDVAASRWSAPFIQFCASRDIINGDGLGKFNPEGKVTGTQFAKMLLKAVGYGKDSEYIGANWELNVIADATSLGIFSLNVDVSAPATREQCAQYAFNTYCFVNQVVYNATTHSYQSAFNTLDPYVTISVQGTLAYMQGVYANYTVRADGQFYRYWTQFGARVSGFYLHQTILATSTNGTSIANLTTPSSNKYKAPLEATPLYYYNGRPVATTDAVKGADTILDRAQHSGVTVQLIDTGLNGRADIVNVVDKEIIKLGSAPVINAATGNVTIAGITGLTDYKASFVDGYAGLAAGDWVLWYVDAAGVYHIAKAQTVTGQMTSFTAGPMLPTGALDTMIFGGALKFETGLTYTATAAMGTPIATFATTVPTTANYNADATAWLDDNGNVIAVKLNNAAPAFSYGLVLDYQYNGSLANSALVKVFKDDGTVGVYPVAPNNLGIVPNQGAAPAGTGEFDFTATTYGYLCQYLINSAGQITLIGNTSTLYAQDTLNANYAARGVVVDGIANDEQLTAATKVFYFDTSNPYNPVTNPAYVTTGTANTAAMTAGTGVGGFDFSYFKMSASFDVAGGLLFNENQPVYTGNNYAYVLYTAVGTHVVGGITYYDYTVIADGTQKTVSSLSSTEFGSAGLWQYKVDSNGYVIPGTSNQTTGILAPVGAGLVSKIMPTYISVDSAESYVVDSNTKYYIVNTLPVPFGMITASTIAMGYTVTYVQMNATGTAAAAIYFHA